MNPKHDTKTLLFGALLGAAILFSIGAATNPGNTKVYEYKTIEGGVNGAIHPDLDVLINTKVSEGWEFVCASGSGNAEFGFAIMKRAKN